VSFQFTNESDHRPLASHLYLIIFTHNMLGLIYQHSWINAIHVINFSESRSVLNSLKVKTIVASIRDCLPLFALFETIRYLLFRFKVSRHLLHRRQFESLPKMNRTKHRQIFKDRTDSAIFLTALWIHEILHTQIAADESLSAPAFLPATLPVDMTTQDSLFFFKNVYIYAMINHVFISFSTV